MWERGCVWGVNAPCVAQPRETLPRDFFTRWQAIPVVPKKLTWLLPLETTTSENMQPLAWQKRGSSQVF
jgi:hypothetical protein